MTARPNSGGEREGRAEGLLAEVGITGGRVTAEGQESEIAALRVPAACHEWLLGPQGRRLAERIRALGFRYVALDLEPDSDVARAAGGEP